MRVKPEWIYPHATRRPAKVRKSRPVALSSVPCPVCGAVIGDPCVSANGKVVSVGHRPRRVQAIRAERVA